MNTYQNDCTPNNNDQKAFLNEDEIDLAGFFAVIWKRKLAIICFVAAASIIAVITVLMMDNIYQSKALLKPTDTKNSGLSSALGGLGGIAAIAGVDLGTGSGNVYSDMD